MPNSDYEEVFDEIESILSSLKIYVNTDTTSTGRYTFDFYQPKSSKKTSKAEIKGDEVHIKVDSGKEFNKLFEAVKLFQLAGYYFKVDWDDEEFKMIWNFDKFYTEDEWNRIHKTLPHTIGTKTSEKIKQRMGLD